MVKQNPARQRLLFSTALVGAGMFVLPSAALADCLPNAGGTVVTCNTSDPDGYNGSAVNSLTINVAPSSTVLGTLAAGTVSTVNNEGNVNVAGTAISVGGGSTVNNATTATGAITGNILFGAAGTGQTNTLNNYLNPTAGSGIYGNVTSAGGAVAVTNNGTLQGTVTTAGNTTVANTGTLTGNLVSTAGSFGLTNSGTITGNLSSVGDTTLNNSGTLTGNVTTGAGNDVVNNSGTISGNVDLGAGTTNVFNATGGTNFPTGTLTAAASSLNTLNLGAGGGTIGAVTNFDVLNVNGPAYNIVPPFPSNAWVLSGPISLADRINVNSGVLAVDNASYLGSNTIVNNTFFDNITPQNLVFIAANTGTYSGNMSGTGTVVVGNGTAGVVTFSGNNSYAGGTYANNGTLRVVGGAALSDTGLVNVDSSGTFDVAAAETIGALNGDGSVTLSGGNLTVNPTTTNGAFSGVISGTNGLVKTGTGSQTLSGFNTYTGNTTVTNGTLVLAGGNAIANGGNVIVNSTATTSGTLRIDTNEVIGSLSGTGGSVVLSPGTFLAAGANGTSTSYAGVISGGGFLAKIGAGTLTLTGANTNTGGTGVFGGTLEGNTTSLQGNIGVNAGTTLLFTQPTNGTYAGNLNGVGTVTMAGPGVLTLTGTNTGLSGTTNLNGGTLAIGSATNIGTGILQFNGGTLQTTAALTLANAVTLGVGGGTVNTGAATTLSGVISGTGALTKTGTGNLTLTAANTYSGGTTVSAGTLTGNTTSLQGNIVDNAALVFDQAAAGTFAGNITGTGSVTTTGAGALTLTGTNSYSGSTTISAGSGGVSATSSALSSASAYTVNGSLYLISPSSTIGSLAGNGLVFGNVGATLNVGANNSSTTYSGSLATIGFNKIGTGTLTLSGTNAANNVAALGVNAGTLILSGPLTATGTTVASGATLNVAAGGALTSPVTAAGGSTAIVNGTITGNVTNSGALSGTGTVNGVLTNSGTLSPGNAGIGILNVNGAFAQTATGTLAIDLTPTATTTAVAGVNYDQILVTGLPGTATLAGTLAITKPTGLYVAGTTYDVVRASGGISGGFTTITGNTISPFINLTPTGIVTLTGTNQVFRLTVVRTNFAVGIGATATPNQIAVANGFQGLVTGATGDAATVVTAVDNMTAAQARLLFDQASPESYGAYANGLATMGELFTRQVALQMHATPNTGEGPSIWGRAYGQWGKGRSRDFRYGTDQDIYGGALGVDFRSGPAVYGVAGGWSHDKLDYRFGNSRGKGNSWQVGTYLDYAMGPIDFDLQAAYIHGKFRASRSINVTSLVRTADARFSGNLFKVIGTVGYNADMGGVTLRPFVGLDYSTGKVTGFTETGAGALNLTVDRMKVRRTDLLAGFDLGSKASTGIAPYARVAYRYALKNRRNDVSAFFNGNRATAFTVDGVRSGRSELDVDAGLSFAISPGSSVFAGYEGTFRRDLRAHGVSAGFRIGLGGRVAPPLPPVEVAPPPPPPPPPATQTCADGSVIDLAASCPVPPPPPPPPAPAPSQGERG